MKIFDLWSFGRIGSVNSRTRSERRSFETNTVRAEFTMWLPLCNSLRQSLNGSIQFYFPGFQISRHCIMSRVCFSGILPFPIRGRFFAPPIIIPRSVNWYRGDLFSSRYSHFTSRYLRPGEKKIFWANPTPINPSKRLGKKEFRFFGERGKNRRKECSTIKRANSCRLSLPVPQVAPIYHRT